MAREYEVTTQRRSFAFDRAGGASWQWYQEAGRPVPIDEMRRHIEDYAAGEGLGAAKLFRADIHTKLLRAQAGTLQVPDDGRPELRLVQGIMEIKWGVGDAQWRLYYCEPLHLQAQRIMVGLHFNRKEDLDQQDAHIREAARRWTSWQSGMDG